MWRSNPRVRSGVRRHERHAADYVGPGTSPCLRRRRSQRPWRGPCRRLRLHTPLEEILERRAVVRGGSNDAALSGPLCQLLPVRRPKANRRQDHADDENNGTQVTHRHLRCSSLDPSLSAQRPAAQPRAAILTSNLLDSDLGAARRLQRRVRRPLALSYVGSEAPLGLGPPTFLGVPSHGAKNARRIGTIRASGFRQLNRAV